MAIVGSNTVSGVSTVTSIDSAVYKQHADNYITANTYPSVSGNSGSYLFTDGSTQSWQQPAGSIEYRTGGTYTYTIPSSASKFYIETISGGGGGSTATLGNPGFPGAGGGAGSYASWFIPRQELGSATTISVGVGTGGVGGNCLGVCGSTDGIVWTQRVHPALPLTTGTPYLRTLFASSTHLIYGDGSAYATSTDSVTWRARTLGTSIFPLGATFGNSTYAMCGQTGVLLTSTNGIEWTSRTAGYTSNINAIIFASTLNQFLYGGSTGGTIATSTDAINWTQRTGPNGMNQSVNIFAFGNGLYFAGYGGGRGAAVSTNGINWVFRTTADPSGNDVYEHTCAVFGNNLWVIGGTIPGASSLRGKIQSSTDTIVWTIRTAGSITFSGTSTNVNSGDMQRGAFATVGAVNTFILCGEKNTIVTSTDTINWIVRTSLFKRPNPIRDVSANSAGYLAVGAVVRDGSTGLRSAVSWVTNNETTILGSSGGFLNGGQGASGSAAGGNANTNPGFDYNTLYSVNGTSGGSAVVLPLVYTAITQTSPYLVTGGGAGAFNTGVGQSSITFNYNNAYGAGGSTSGGNGTEGLPNSYTVSYGSGGSGGGALTRGIYGWYMRTSGLAGTGAADVIFGASTYLTSNAAARIATSTDSIAWTLRTVGAPTNTNITTLAFGTSPTNTFVAAFSAGSIQASLNTSTDAINWTLRTAPSDFLATIADVIYTGATPLYITTSSGRSLNTSTDAISWTIRTTGFGAAGGGNIQSAAYASTPTQKFAITGTVRALSTSTDALSWTVRTLGTASTTMNTITSNNTIFVTGGLGNRIFTSTNGIEWTARTSGIPPAGVNIGRIRFKNNYFIAGPGLAQIVRISTDAITWESAFHDVATTTINGFDFNSSTSTYIGACNNGAIVTAETTVQSVAGNGGNGTRGGGGGGGGYSNVLISPAFGMAGDGGDGYVRITWW